MKFTRDNRNSFLRLTAGWSALWLYVAACSPVGLGLAALAGSLDSRHQIFLGAGECGGRLVLHHGNGCAQHQHGLIARALTLFAQPASPSEPDHILQFSSSDNFKSQAETSAPQPNPGELPFGGGLGAFLAHAPEAFVLGVAVHPPPDVSGAQLGLRTTVLLI
ncbi:MAG: hypothetical protein EPO07_07910 [Verrucomicrobia bacterium]|nr:MAG: hypothetical protein EPO07_07910 [Verrucomicrobiota bacterium]